DDEDTLISFSFQEVEERCKQEYELWAEKQRELEHERIKQLKAKRDMKEILREEEEKKRKLRQEELEQQQAVMEKELLKEKEAWKEQLRHHEELINNLHTQIQEEKTAFDKQQAMERQQQRERQNMAAVKIQTTFRAFAAYKKYAPILKQQTMELKRKRELQEAVEREMKEKQERWNRRVQEKKEQAEKERKIREDQEKEEHVAKMKRYEEYEKKKEIMRVHREQLMLEELKREENVKLKSVIEKKINSENMDKDIQLAKKEQEIGKAKEDNKTEKIKRCLEPQNISTTLEMADKEKEIQMLKEKEKDIDEKAQLIKEKEENKQIQEISHEEKKVDGNNIILEKVGLANIGSEDEKLKSGREEHLTELNNEKSVKNDINYLCLATIDLQGNINTNPLNTENITLLNQESSVPSKHSSVDSGDTRQMDEPYASENMKMELGLKESHEEATDVWAKSENSVSLAEQPLMFSDSIEEKRLLWMKTCKSWSRIYMEHQKKKIIDRNRPRKCSANLMPPLSAAMIIEAGSWNALQQVTTVTFQDLPGCSLSTLSQCSKLQFLSLRRCGLLALEGLSNCKNLKYIDVEENNIQVIDCENLENLCILLLNKNNISCIHGLFGCTNLWNLELSYNKITRIDYFKIGHFSMDFCHTLGSGVSGIHSGLESLKNLQRLVVSHNQLISTKGLSDTPTLVYIDCSFNHLNEVEGIQNCGLLQILKLQGNNLNEFPSLENHVLLRELYLEDNSISSLEICSTYWLPLLQILLLSQNSLTQLAPLFSFISLKKLDISNNCLLDTKSIIQWFGGCDSLRELSIQGNPLLLEENWRCTLLKILPNLKILNDENIRSNEEIPGERIKNRAEPGTFAAFCQVQIQAIDFVIQYISENSLQCLYFMKLMKLSSEHRYSHEYGVLNNTEGEEPEKQTYHLNQEAINITEKNNFFIAGVKENKQVSLNMPERWITSGHTQTRSVNSFMALAGMGKNHEYKQRKKSKWHKSQFLTILCCFYHIYSMAATVIQSCWRSYRVRKDINFFTRLHLAATVIQSFWRSYCVKKKTVSYSKEGDHFMDENKAATILQALWKGFCLRKKLASALAAVKTDEAEDDYREVNVDDFLSDAVRNERARSDLLILTCSCRLDPAVRLALFKNNENKHPPMKPPKKAQTAKTSYFEGKHRKNVIFCFLIVYILSHCFQTSPVRREDTDLELVSMTSGSTLTQNREKNNQPHRHSPGSSSKLCFSFNNQLDKTQIT
uniref:Leucine rich repeats and IQ motif containing 1 n=1 Tax=Varanus komodoensis TaxID=61221 RepID=A0A8D2LBF1_VARKO